MTSQARIPIVLFALAGLLPEALLAADASTAREARVILRASCWGCHGAEKQKGRLRLDSHDAVLKGGKSGAAIFPGHAARSILYERLISADEDERMPKGAKALAPEQIATIQAWIDQGASWEDDSAYWAFVPPKPVSPPAQNSSWVKNPIDQFILGRLAGQKLVPSPEAPRTVLIRRLSLDLIGLPPTPEEVDAFVNDPSPDAYGKLVDRLLASPHYGERWARHWLDLARFAESEGFKADETRPDAWRYRDYVVDSFNQNKPYDRFVQEQLAGDELWPDDPQARVATGFNRHYPDESNARNLFQRRQEILNDITDTVGSVFFGMTFGCARCHDHKYDPITQADYYKLQAFFADVRAADDVPLLTPAQLADYQKKLANWEEKTKAIREEMARIEEPKRKAILKDYFDKYPAEIQAILKKPAAQRSPLEQIVADKAALYMDPASHQFLASQSAVAGSLKGEQKKRWEELKAQLDQFKSLHPGPIPTGTMICDAGAEAPATYVLSKGVYDAPKEEVKPGVPAVLDRKPMAIPRPANAHSTGRRAALARWLTEPNNPLTARIMVNRLWSHHFGRGIVGTPSDFGVKGDQPTHPELLDYLARRFVDSGWNIKAMQRLIVTSAAYRQGSDYREAAAKVDPEDRLLWRYPRQRLEGEAIRDESLAVAGLLDERVGGPSVFPPIPPGMESRGGWHVSARPADQDRRSIYIFVRRNTLYPMLEVFDMPDTHESCPRRYNTTTPLQALTLLNDKLTLQWAQAFAGRVIQEAGTDAREQIKRAYRIAVGRLPTASEMDRINSFFSRQEEVIGERISRDEPVMLPTWADTRSAPTAAMDKAQAATLVDFCHLLMSTNEFVYRN